MRRAAPYGELTREVFDEVSTFVTKGIVDRPRTPRAPTSTATESTARSTGRRGARLAALTSGGAIPEIADYRVVADPDDTVRRHGQRGLGDRVAAGRRLPAGHPLVADPSHRARRGAGRRRGAARRPRFPSGWARRRPEPPSCPKRSRCCGSASSERIRSESRPRPPSSGSRPRAGIDDVAATMMVAYLAAALAVLGELPTVDRLVIERFFDQTGGMQLVVHAPFGGRINRAFGLALRKKFCVNFDFELQAAANDDAVVLSLGPQHSFALDEVPRYLRPEQVPQTLTQAVLVPPSPMFISRWRWNLNRSLTVLRFKGGRKNPPPIQRMEADDLMAAAFPSAAGCQENVNGPIEIPDHPIVRQTMYDSLHEAMDVDGLVELVRRLESGDLAVTCVDTIEPSPLAHELLVGPPYTFLDDAEAIDRRTRAVPLRRGIPVDLTEIGGVDRSAIDRVRIEAQPDVRTADELHDLLTDMVRTRPRPQWQALLDELVARGRAYELPGGFWSTAEQHDLALSIGTETIEGEEALAAMVRGHLATTGPITTSDLAELCGAPTGSVAIALVALEGTGYAIRGTWAPGEGADTQWCSRQLLARIHVYSQKQRRREIEPVTAAQFMQFLFRWQHLSLDAKVKGRAGLLAVLEQLQGYEVPAGSWESVLAARVADYQPVWLDELCLGGEVVWGRLSPRGELPDPQQRLAPSRATRISLATRADFGWLLAAGRRDAVTEPDQGLVADIVSLLDQRGARFHSELVDQLGKPATEVDDALWDAVGLGLVAADSFSAVRQLFAGRQARTAQHSLGRRGLRRGASGHDRAEGRWALLPAPMVVEDADELAEAVAEQLLARWGVVFRDLVATESLAVSWREILWAFRRLEARGLIRGGRFVKGFTGEQYASVEALRALREIRKGASSTPGRAEIVDLLAVDPCNLTGVVVPGERVRAVGSTSIRFRNGAVE